jgi:phosphoribosylformylglycinamidine (FGAM) synthase-like enzyme
MAYGTPFISGKDSLYNESPLGPVAPTLLITALGVVPDVRKAVTMDLKRAGDPVYLIGTTKPELGGSEYYRLSGFMGASVPRLEARKTIEAYRRLTSAMDEGLVAACHDLSEGGLGVAAAEMAFTGSLGLEIELSSMLATDGIRDDLTLFSESNGRLLVEAPEVNADAFEVAMKGVQFARVGEVTGGEQFRITSWGRVVFDEPLEGLMAAWKTPLGGPR